jgi:hypothetical protein
MNRQRRRCVHIGKKDWNIYESLREGGSLQSNINRVYCPVGLLMWIR